MQTQSMLHAGLLLGTVMLGGCAGAPGCNYLGAAGEVSFAKTTSSPDYCRVAATYTNREPTQASVQLLVRAEDRDGKTVTEQPLLFSRLRPGEAKSSEIIDARICQAQSVQVVMAEKMSAGWNHFTPGSPVCGVTGSRYRLDGG